MEQIFTGPGKITIELTAPKPPPAVPDWKRVLRFFFNGFVILAIFTFVHAVSDWYCSF